MNNELYSAMVILAFVFLVWSAVRESRRDDDE